MKRIVLLIASVAGLAAAAHAQPAYMNYQGRLLDAGGQPLEFNIYDSPNGTNRVWGPFLCDTNSGDGHAARAVVANGRFNVILGPNDTATRPLTGAFLEDERFVEIKVNGGDPILPRQQFLSAPYAMRAEFADHAGNAALATNALNADNLNQLPPTDYFLPPGMVAPFAGPTDNIPAGWLLCDGGQLATSAYPRLYAAIGTSWGSAAPGYFRLPDLRGLFLRGVSQDRNDGFQDPNRSSRTNAYAGGNTDNAVGSYQYDDLQSHEHKIKNSNSGGSDVHMAYYGDPGGALDPVNPHIFTQLYGGLETRPKNAYVNYIIKY